VAASRSTDRGTEPAQDSAVVSDRLSPDDIEKTTFHSTSDGYDKVEVEVFLGAVATDMHALQRELESARLSAHRPLEALGREMGALMQHAHDAAERVKKSAETEAATTLQRAHRDATKLRQDAEQLKKRYETETLVARDEAMATVDRLREQADQQRRLAEAESSIMHQEAWRSVKRIQEEAKRKAQEILVKADSEASARTAESERRLRKLQEVETRLRRRIEFLSTKLQAMTEQVKQTLAEEQDSTEERREEPSGRPSPSANIRITDNGAVRLDPSEQRSESQIAPNRG
jgi:DivIVA domain-containing protein